MKKTEPKARLIIDTCCDLPAEIAVRDDIDLLNFTYILDHGTFTDDFFQTIKPHDFYEKMRKGAEPTTSQLGMPVLLEKFESAAKDGTPTVYLSFSSGLSGSYDVALMAREQVLTDYPDFELYVVDTALASIAEGLLVFSAISQWESGMTAKELVEWSEEAKNFVNCEFMVDSLDVLKRGGRIPSSLATAGSVLDVKPLLNIDSEGKLQAAGVSRGRKKGLRTIAEHAVDRMERSDAVTYVIVGHADCEKDALRVRDAIEKEIGDAIILVSNIGPVIGSHVGAGMVGVTYWGSDRRDSMNVASKIASAIKRSDKK